MIVCENCSKLGTIQKKQKPSKFVQVKQRKKPKQQKRTYKNNEPSEELIEDFNINIRKAREAKNWSREDLGKKINERVSVINRIESGKMTPDLKLTKKLEKTLNITLLENINELDLNQFINNSSNERTLGNVMKIKRK